MFIFKSCPADRPMQIKPCFPQLPEMLFLSPLCLPQAMADGADCSSLICVTGFFQTSMVYQNDKLGQKMYIAPGTWCQPAAQDHGDEQVKGRATEVSVARFLAEYFYPMAISHLLLTDLPLASHQNQILPQLFRGFNTYLKTFLVIFAQHLVIKSTQMAEIRSIFQQIFQRFVLQGRHHCLPLVVQILNCLILKINYFPHRGNMLSSKIIVIF